MNNSELNLSKEKTISDALDEINPNFFNWLIKIPKCHTVRAVSVSTLLLNFNLQMNYFPLFNTLQKEIPDLIPKDQKKNFAGFTFTSENIFGIIILAALKFKSQIKISMEKTDELINKLWLSGPLVNSFFAFNCISNKFYELKLKDIMDFLPKFTIKDKLLPKLEFDPEFEKLLQNDAVKQIYDTNFITDWLESREPKPYKYLPEKETFLRNWKLYKDKKTKIFDIDPSLTISKFAYRYVNITPSSFFSSNALIDELIRVFSEYYMNKLPHREDEISEVLSCFGEVLKLIKGKFYQKFRYNHLVKKLKSIHSQGRVKEFLETFCLSQDNLSILEHFDQFNPKQFNFEYNRFLSYAAYRISGFIYTGSFLVWRAMIKYLDSLQNEDEFKLSKGPLLEKWCYDKAIEFGFKPEKIVLTNPMRTPTEKYYNMKEQIKDFPKPALEFEVDFPPDYEASFHEIDLAIRLEEFIFIFECKTTNMPIGEIGDYIKWLNNFGYNFQLLLNKGDILLYNVEKGKIKHSFFQDVKYYAPIYIQTEGIISRLLGMDLSTYVHFLRVLKENIDNDTIKEYLKNNFRIPKSNLSP